MNDKDFPNGKPAPTNPIDEFHGVGGSYTLDPATGKRTQVARPTIGPGEEGYTPPPAPDQTTQQ